MLDIIIYSNNITTIRKSEKAINIALVNYEFEYNLHIISSFDKLSNIITNKNRKIYIIDEYYENNCNIASTIRENDFTSIIILVNISNNNYDMLINKRLMALDYILDSNNYLLRLKDDINLSLKIIYGDNTFVFKYNHMLYRIPYNDINYIEKEPLVKRCIIHTLDKEYYIVSSIEKILHELENSFIKTHQSCIINMNNVSGLDLSNNTICFKNGDNTSLLTNKMKKKLKKCVNL